MQCFSKTNPCMFRAMVNSHAGVYSCLHFSFQTILRSPTTGKNDRRCSTEEGPLPTLGPAMTASISLVD